MGAESMCGVMLGVIGLQQSAQAGNLHLGTAVGVCIEIGMSAQAAVT